MNFENQHVVVTGASGVLGAAVVARLLAAGATCHLPVRDGVESALSRQADRPGVHVTSGVDLTEAAAVEAFYAALPELWASLHIAGGFAMAPLAKTTAEEFRHMLEMNALTCFLSCREAAKTLRARPSRAAGVTGGRIVNVAARPALEPRGGAGMAAYTASKAAVAALTLALAEELAPEKIWVNAVAPSIIDTPANRAAMPKADHAAWPKAEEIAETIVFLAAPENKSTRGAVVPVYGKA